MVNVDAPTANALSTGSPFARRATTFHRYDVWDSRSSSTVKTVSEIPVCERVTCEAVSVMNSSYTHAPGGSVTAALRHLNVGRRVKNVTPEVPLGETICRRGPVRPAR